MVLKILLTQLSHTFSCWNLLIWKDFFYVNFRTSFTPLIVTLFAKTTLNRNCIEMHFNEFFNALSMEFQCIDNDFQCIFNGLSTFLKTLENVFQCFHNVLQRIGNVLCRDINNVDFDNSK